jgi:hypothetical protein
MIKRVYDLAGIFAGKLKVYLNKELIKLTKFEDYVDLYLTNAEAPKLMDKAMNSDRWEVLVSISDDCSF